jgi:hypothetical protein
MGRAMRLFSFLAVAASGIADARTVVTEARRAPP